MNPVIFKPSPESQHQGDVDVPPSRQLKKLKRELLRSFRLYKVFSIAVAVLVFVAILMFGLSRKPYYETSSLIYVQPAKARLITDATGGTYDPTRYDTYIQQQLQTVIRTDILTEALKALPVGTWAYPGESEQSAVARLQRMLTVEREMGSYQIEIGLSGANPAAITSVVNAVTNTYIRMGRTDELAQTTQQLGVLLTEQKRLQAEMTSNRQSQTELSSALGVADTAGDNGNPYDAQLQELRTQLATARGQYETAEAQISALSRHGADSSPALKAAADEMIAGDIALSTLKQSIAARRSKLIGEMAGLTPKNPLYKQDEEELQRLDQSVEGASAQLRDKAAKQLIEKLRLDAARASDIVARLQAQLSQQTSIATGAAPKLQQAADVAAKVARLQLQLTEVDNAIAAIQLENQSTGLVHLLLPAEVPLRPKPSKKLIILGASLPLAILVALLAAWIRHKVDPRVYIAEDVENVLGFPPMAVLPDGQEVEGKVVDEFMLRLVAGLDNAHTTSGARTFAFTSASPNMEIGDVLTKLADKMDKLGYRTMILKASTAFQRLSAGSPVEDEELFETSWNTRRLEEPRPQETRLSRPNESRLARPRRESFVTESLERLKENVDLLFIEALPLRLSTEAEFAARLADVTVLMVESAQTTREELSTTMEAMQRLNVAGVATVLNDMRLQFADGEFLAIVQGVEERRSVRREAPSSADGSYPVSVYGADVASSQPSEFQTTREE